MHYNMYETIKISNNANVEKGIMDRERSLLRSTWEPLHVDGR